MAVTTFEAVVENGQVRLPAGVVLPDRQTVLVVVPDPAAPPARAPGVRLADPADAARFEMTVSSDPPRLVGSVPVFPPVAVAPSPVPLPPLAYNPLFDAWLDAVEKHRTEQDAAERAADPD